MIAYDSLPDRIPVHFNLSGEADRWADRSGYSLWLMPMIWTLLGLLLLIVLRFPRAFNFPRKAEVLALPLEYQQSVHRLNRKLLLAVCVLTGGLFVYLQQAIIDSAYAGTSTLSLFGVFAPLAGMMAILIVYLVRIRRVVDEAVKAAKDNSNK